MSDIDVAKSALDAVNLIGGLVKDMLSRGDETRKHRAASTKRLATVLDEIKTDLSRGVVPRQNGHTFIAFLNLQDDLIKKVDRKYRMLHLMEMMRVTREKIDEADLFIKDGLYTEKYESGAFIDDFYAAPVQEAVAQIERLVGTLIAISDKLNPSA